jgi:hypothetical protein
MKDCLPAIRKAFEAQSLIAQNDAWIDYEQTVINYLDNEPVSVCLSADVREHLAAYNPDVTWSYGIATFYHDGIIEMDEDELLDLARLQYWHQAWYQRPDKDFMRSIFERTLWELEDKYEVY